MHPKAKQFPRRLFRKLNIEALEHRRVLAGVTLITHGFNSSADGWVTAMANATAQRPDVDVDQSLYRIDVTEPAQNGGPITVQSNFLSGASPTDVAADNPEITIVMDWSAVAGSPTGGYTRSTGDVAQAVANQLVSDNFLAGLAQPVATLPFHLLGHSRGAAFVGELARELGERGIWVDHVTTFDPHPVDGIREPWLFNQDFGDAPMAAWNNVAYWDNYWRSEGNSELLDVTGETIAQTHDVRLDESLLSNGGYDLEHSDTHLWYYGTIDTSENPPAFNGDEEVPNNWYGGVHPDRNASGYHYSRLVGGDRATDGLIDTLGGTAMRVALDQTAANWPNVLNVELSSPGSTFNIGDSFTVDFLYQDVDSSANVLFSLDTDRNPFNGGQTQLAQTPVSASATLTTATSDPPLSTTGLTAGDYYVLATIDDGVQQRHSYLELPITLSTDSGNNTPPVADDDLAETDEGQSVSIDVLFNDTDDDAGDLLSVVSVQSPTTNGGSVVIEVDDTLTYTPAVDYFGTDTFTYTITDGNGGSDSATVSVAVAEVADAGIVVTILDQETDESGETAQLKVKLNSSPSASVTINVTTTDPSEGSVGTETLLFSDVNWGVDQTITITGVDDLLVDGDIDYNIVLDPSSSDVAYSALANTSVTITNRDNDEAVAERFDPISSGFVDNVNYQTPPSEGSTSSPQTLTEGIIALTGGRKPKTTSGIDYYAWDFGNVTQATSFVLNASRTTNQENDNFQFEYAVNQGSWQPLTTVSNAIAATTVVDLPGLSGDLQVRVRDTNRSQRNTTQEVVTINDIYFEGLTTDLRQGLSVVTTDPDAFESNVADTGTFRFDRDGSGDLTVHFAIAGSATLGDDYTVTSSATSLDIDPQTLLGSFMIPDNATSAEFTITAIQDSDAEGLEDIELSILDSDTYLYKSGTASSATVSIADDDLLTYTAIGESTQGTVVSGSYLNTQEFDGLSEVLEERESSGKRQNRHTFLEQFWDFGSITNVTAFQAVVSATTANNSNEFPLDNFEFSYAVNNGDWQPLGSISAGSSGPINATFEPPLNGAVQVRLVDTDQSPGERSKDQIEIDLLEFSSAGAAPLAAVAAAIFIDPADVDRDGQVSPLDALLVTNYLNGFTSAANLMNLDINGDRFISPVDALVIINRLNRDQLTQRRFENDYQALVDLSLVHLYDEPSNDRDELDGRQPLRQFESADAAELDRELERAFAWQQLEW